MSLEEILARISSEIREILNSDLMSFGNSLTRHEICKQPESPGSPRIDTRMFRLLVVPSGHSRDC